MKKVLIIDDSRTARVLLKCIFIGLKNWECVEAENGKVALDYVLSSEVIDLVCVDWNMPVMSGIEFIAQAKKHPQSNIGKIMVITTETEMSNMMEAIELGADEYVMKPINKEVILAKLDIMGIPYESVQP